MKMDAESYLKTGSNELRVLEYRIGGQSFGINILKVNKIIKDLVNFTKMPDSHYAISGIFRDMNQVIPIIDLAVFLEIPSENKAQKKIVVTEFFGQQTGFMVDRVDWIHHFLWEDVIDTQKVFAGIDHKNVIGIVKPTEERMVLLLDYETILLDLSPNLREKDAQTYTGDADFNGKKVLVVEDSPAVRSMLVSEMSVLGFNVVETNDGAIAWEEFKKQKFDLVISDVEMPQMDGLALTLKIRESEHPDTPVIVYSSIGDAGMKARASFLKADAHITKLNFDQLLKTAEKLLNGEKIGQQVAFTTEQAKRTEEVTDTILVE